MRSLAAGERALLGGTPLAVKGRVEVLDSDGTWRNVSSLSGYDFFDGAEWGGNPDDPVQSATITLRRQAGPQAGNVNISPLIGASPVNRNAAADYVPFLKENSRIRLFTAEGLPGFTPGSNANNSWHLVFEGKIDDVTVTKPTVVLSCRDLGAFLQQASIETEQPYGTDPAPGVALETIMQQIITAWVPSPPTMVVPVASGAYRTLTKADKSTFTIPVGNVMDALQNLAAEIGWVCRYEWGSGDTYELRFYRPALKGSDDTTFGPAEYFSSDYKISDADIRNVVKASFDDGSGAGGLSYTSTDSASIGAPGNYGRRFMVLAMQGSSGVDTLTELQRLTDAAIADLSTPYASHRIETFYFWPVERGDRHGYLANNNLYDSTQTLYVVDFRHVIGGGKGRTIINARGKPVARYRSWWEILDSAAGIIPFSQLDVVATEYATTYSIAWSGVGIISVSVDGGAWVTPPATNPIVVTRNPENGATKIYRFRSVLGLDETIETIYVLAIGAISPPPNLTVTPSAQTSLVAAYTVTCTNPRSGGPAPVVTVFAVGASGTVALFGGGSATVTDGASPITIPSGSVVTMTKPTAGNPAGSVIFRGTLAGGSIAEIQRTVLARTTTGPNLDVVATPYASTYSIAWSGDAVQLSIDGGSLISAPTAPLNATPIIVNRPAVGSPDKVYSFKGTLSGQVVTNTITVPAIGSPETPNLSVVQGTQADTTVQYTVTATLASGGAAPVIVMYLTDCTADYASGSTLASGTVVTANRPVIGGKKDGSIRFRATNGASYEEIIRSVPIQVQLSFGPNLEVIPEMFATTYSIYFSGDSVLVDKRDGAGFVSPGSSPMTGSRPAMGDPDKVFTFRATKDGQEVTNSITIPAIGHPGTPNLNVVPQTPSSTQQSYVVTFTGVGGTPTCAVWVVGCTIASSHTNGGAVTSGDTVIINKPAFGSQAGTVRFIAELGGSTEEIQRTVVTAIKTSFGPTLDVGFVAGATSYSINWNGGSATVTYYYDSAGPYTPGTNPSGVTGTNPLVVARAAYGGDDHLVTMRADLDGQLITNSVLVPAQVKTTFGPNLEVNVTPGASSYSVAWSGTSVTVSIDGASYGTPSTSPIVVTRDSSDHTYVFKGTADGQTLTYYVLVPSLGAGGTGSIPMWDSGTSYAVDDFVIYNSRLYRATGTSTGTTPTVSMVDPWILVG